MKLVPVVMLLMLALAPVSIAGGQSLEQIRKMELLDKFSDSLNEITAAFETESRVRRTEYLKAIGNQIFCTCISEKLAVAWSFADYVAITTRSKEINGYDELQSDLKIAYDRVGPVRDECVASSVAP